MVAAACIMDCQRIAKSIECTTVVMVLVTYALLAVLNVDIGHHHGIQFLCASVYSLGKGIPIVLVHQHHHHPAIV